MENQSLLIRPNIKVHFEFRAEKFKSGNDLFFMEDAPDKKMFEVRREGPSWSFFIYEGV